MSKAFCYGAPKVCPDFRGEAKNNQCHGTVALARWAPYIKMLEDPFYFQVIDLKI